MGTYVKVTVEGDNDEWIKESNPNGSHGGVSKVNVPYLRKVVLALENALAQASVELSSAKLEAGDTKFMNRKEFNQYKVAFIDKEKELFERILGSNSGRQDPLGKELIQSARTTLGYSDSYIDQDIFRSLVNTYKRRYERE